MPGEVERDALVVRLNQVALRARAPELTDPEEAVYRVGYELVGDSEAAASPWRLGENVLEISVEPRPGVGAQSQILEDVRVFLRHR